MSNEASSRQEAHTSLEECVLARVWWAGRPLSGKPLAEFVVPRAAPLPVLVYGLLAAIGFHEDHLWCLAHPREPVGSRRVGAQHDWSVPDHWRYIRRPADADMYEEPADYADTFTVNELAAGEDDEAWLLFDFGDHHTFRFKFNALTSNRAPARAARTTLQQAGLLLPSIADRRPVTILDATRIEQYPSDDDEPPAAATSTPHPVTALPVLTTLA